MPPKALGISVAALAVPVVGALALPELLGEHGALLWLMALVPAFVLAYYKGWRGVASALALGVATLLVTQLLATWMLLRIPEMLLTVVVAYLAICCAIGILAEFFHRERDQVEEMAFTDLLTRLPNRRHARIFLENEFAAAERGRTLTIALFDLDGFKQYNDNYGHQAGDEAIKAFADVLARTTRRMNLSARFGGEEYISILAGSDVDGALVFAERVRTAFEGLNLGDPTLTVSAGVAAFEPGMKTINELVSAADEALYRAKREGRNRVRLFSGSFADLTPKSLDADEAGSESDSGSVAVPNPDPALVPADGGDLGRGRRVLLVESDEATRELLGAYLSSEGFEVEAVGRGRSALDALDREFDVVLADVDPNARDGTQLVSTVKDRWPATQVVVTTGLHTGNGAGQALTAGADRYLFKPFPVAELERHLVDALANRDRLQSDPPPSIGPTARPASRSDGAVESAAPGALSLVRAAETRDPYTRGHSARVAAYAAILADGIDPEGTTVDRKRLKMACELYDVGKIGVSDAILNKEGPLTASELAEVRRHPREGHRILEPLLQDALILGVTLWHHERWDGTGYPDALRGEEIPPAARVVGLADALDAMTCPRSYRNALPWEDALATIRDQSDQAFDPALVAYMDDVLPQLKRVHASGRAALTASA